MKIITIGSGNAVRMPKILFKDYTQEEVDKLIKEKADASYKAGLEKAKQNDDLKELENLRKEKAERERNDMFDKIKNNLKNDDLKETGIKSFNMFADNYHERLNGKEGKTLAQEVNKIKNELVKNKDNEKLEAFFGITEVDATGAIARVIGNEPKKKISDEFYPGTTIRKK